MSQKSISKASPSDHQKLTTLTKLSKAYWGFGAEQIESWSEELTITAAYIDSREVYKLELSGVLVGYYAYFQTDETSIKLENLFIDPIYIAQGLGAFLMKDFLKRVGEAGFEKVVLDSEPKAEGFYQKFGFKTVGSLPSSIPGRYLPIMQLHID